MATCSPWGLPLPALRYHAIGRHSSSCRSGMRRKSVSSAMRACSRARWAPRQPCGPTCARYWSSRGLLPAGMAGRRSPCRAVAGRPFAHAHTGTGRANPAAAVYRARPMHDTAAVGTGAAMSRARQASAPTRPPDGRTTGMRALCSGLDRSVGAAPRTSVSARFEGNGVAIRRGRTRGHPSHGADQSPGKRL